MFGSLVKDTSTTTGNGALTLSGTAVSGFRRPQDIFWPNNGTTNVGIYFQYHIYSLDGLQHEAGIGRLTAANTLERTVVEATINSGVAGSGTALSLSAGTKYVVCSPIGQGIMPTLPTVYTSATTRILSSAWPVGTPDTLTTSNAVVYYQPFYLTSMDTIAGVACRVTSAGTGNVVCGLYTMDPATGVPKTKLANGAALAVTSTGLRNSNFTGVTIPPGWYFLACQTQNSDPVVASMGGATITGSMNSPLGVGASDVQIVGFTETIAYSATMPATAGTLTAVTGEVPNLWAVVA
jgi:hypothetical protein